MVGSILLYPQTQSAVLNVILSWYPTLVGGVILGYGLCGWLGEARGVAFLPRCTLWQNACHWSQGWALALGICLITLSPENAELPGNAKPFH